MTSTTKSTVHTYPHPVLTPAAGKPTPLWCRTVRRELLANAASVRSDSISEECWAKVVLPAAEWSTLFPQSTVQLPTHPETKPTLSAAGGEAALYLALLDAYKEEASTAQKVTEVQRDLRAMLLAAVDTVYLKQYPLTPSQAVFGIGCIPVPALLQWLQTEYGTMTDQEVEDNRNLHGWYPRPSLMNMILLTNVTMNVFTAGFTKVCTVYLRLVDLPMND